MNKLKAHEKTFASVVLVLGVILLLADPASACGRRARKHGSACDMVPASCSISNAYDDFSRRSIYAMTVIGQNAGGVDTYTITPVNGGTYTILDNDANLKYVINVYDNYPGTNIPFVGLWVSTYSGTPPTYPTGNPVNSAAGTSSGGRHDETFWFANGYATYDVVIFAKYKNTTEEVLSRRVFKLTVNRITA